MTLIVVFVAGAIVGTFAATLALSAVILGKQADERARDITYFDVRAKMPRSAP